MHSVSLQAGDMLFYESAKCLHGRMQALKGHYYGSIFLHYKPIERSLWGYDVDQVIASVPPQWMDNVEEDKGSRWAGQAITVDSLAVAGAPPRVVLGQYVHSRVSPHANVDDSSSSSNHDEL